MNTNRLATIVNLIHGEVRSTNLVKTLTQLTTQVQEAINSPNESTQRAVENTFSQLTTTLQAAESNRLSPGLRSDLDELKVVVGDTPVTHLVGQELLDRLRQVFANGYISVQTLDALRKLTERVTALGTALDSAKRGLADLNVTEEALLPGESVAGMTVPRLEVRDGLRELLKELAFFDQFVLNLSECVDGQAHDPQVVSLRSSHFGIDVSTNIDVAAMIALIVKGVKLAHDKLEKYRDLKKKAEEVGVDEATIAHLTKQGVESMNNAVEEIEAEVFQHCKLNDAGRVNELKTAVKFKINGIANRMERGFTFEVRTALPPQPDENAAQMGEIINSLSSVRFVPLSGPRLLALPEGEEVELDGEEPHAAKKKRKKAGD